jgi:XRE family transcriptional regulator, regulator of sulfur utilization
MMGKPKIILPHRKAIGEAIRRCRKHIKLTQEALAKQVHLNPKYIGEVERGEKIISIEVLMRIPLAVDVPVAEFLRGI